MPEFDFDQTEAWNTTLRLVTNTGRLRIGSNLKAADDAHTAAFTAAGRACAMIAEASALEGGPRVSAYREGRAQLAQCSAWLQVLASLINEPSTVFAEELEMADKAAHQLSASARAAERGPGAPPRFDRPRGTNMEGRGDQQDRGSRGPKRGPGPRRDTRK